MDDVRARNRHSTVRHRYRARFAAMIDNVIDAGPA